MIKDETVAFAVLKLALEALNTCGEDEWHSDEDFGLMQTYNENLVNYAIIAIKEALAQTSTQCEKQQAQEPVAVWELQETGWDTICDGDWLMTLPIGTKLYTTPQQHPWGKPWVSLTDEEIEDCWDGYLSDYQLQIIREIEAKLKSVNGFLKEKNSV